MTAEDMILITFILYWTFQAIISLISSVMIHCHYLEKRDQEIPKYAFLQQKENHSGLEQHQSK